MNAGQSTSCLFPGCENSGDFKRGLCSTHYNQFDAQKRRMNDSQQQEFDDRLVEEGLLLPPAKRGRKAQSSPFKDIADEIIASDDQSVAAGIDAAATKAVKRRQATKKRASSKQRKRAE